MPDGTINVKITAEASGFTSGINQSADSVKKLQSELTKLQSDLAKTETQVAEVTQGFGEQAKAAVEAQSGIAGMRAEITARQGQIAQINAEIVARKALTAAAMENARAENQASTGVRYYSEIPEQLDQASEAHHRLQFATAGTTREFIVLGHEAISGNFNRIPGSILVLAERMGSLHTIVESLAGPWGVVAAAGVGALAAIGYAAYQAIEGVLALRDATDRLVRAGVSYGEAKSQAQGLANVLRTEFHESGRTIRDITDELDKLPTRMQGSREQLARLGEAYAQSAHLSSAKGVEAVVSHSSTPEELLKFLEANVDLEHATTRSGQSLKSVVEALDKAGEAQAAVNVILEAGMRGWLGMATAQQKQRNELEEYSKLLAVTEGLYGESNLAAVQLITPPKELPKENTGEQQRGEPPERPEILAGNKVNEELNKVDRERVDLATQFNTLKKAEVAITEQLEAAVRTNNAEGVQKLNTLREANRVAQSALIEQATRTHTTDEANEHAANIEVLAGRLAAEHNNAEEVKAIRREIADAELAYETENIAKMEAIRIAAAQKHHGKFEDVTAQDIAEALPQARQMARPIAEQQAPAIRRENQVLAAEQREREDNFKIWIDQMREAEAQAGQSGAQRIAIEQQVNRVIHEEAQRPTPRVNAAAVEAADKHLLEVKKQAQDEALQTTLRNLDEEARAHEHNLDRVVEIERRKYEAIRNLEIQRLEEQHKTPEEAGQLADQNPQVAAQANAIADAQRRAQREALEIAIETERARADATESGSSERLAAEQKILELLQQAQEKEQVGKREVLAQEERVASARRAHANELIRLIEADKTARLKALDDEITNARHNEALIEELLRQRIKIIEEVIAKENQAREAAGVKLSPEAQHIEVLKNQAEISEANKRLDAQKQTYADREAHRAVERLEAQRHALDHQEQAELRSVERQRQMGTIAAGAAGEAEARIVDQRSKATQQILAAEADKARGIEDLENQIADRAIEAAQRDADKEQEIREKTQEELLKRAKEIDKELASTLADAIMGVAEHKESWGQAIAKFFEAQEKKLLEKSLQKLFEQSGLGESLGGLGDLFGLGESGSNDPNVALRTATADNTAASRANTAALLEFANELRQRVEATAAGTGTGAGTGAGTGTATGGTSGSSGIESVGTHGSASENVANFNYGNMRAKGGGWQSFASPEAGALAIGAQLDRYASGATTGKPVTTLEGMISTWAPPNENNTAELIKRASERTGIAPGETVDLSNPDVRRAMTQAIVQQENLKAVEQAMAAYDRAVAGGGTQLAAAPSSDIIDKTAALGFGEKYGHLENVQGMIVHHTSGGKNVDDIIRTFKERDVASQFVIDRSGQTYRTLPEGAEGRHIKTGWGPVGEGKSNANMEGVEIIAANDRDVLPIQREAAARLIGERAERWGYDPRTSVFGHGEVNPGHKEADEGMSTVSRIRSGELLVPTDIRAIAGSTVPRPATTSGGGLPVAVAAPPSATTGQPAAATTLGAYLDKAAPLYSQVTGGSDLRADLTAAAGGGLGAIGPGLRLKGALDNPELKAIVDQASAGYKAKTGNDLLADVQSGKSLADILATKIEANTEATERNTESKQQAAGTTPPQYAEGGPVGETGLALVHEGEYVVPAEQVNDAFRAGIANDFKDFAAHPLEYVKGVFRPRSRAEAAYDALSPKDRAQKATAPILGPGNQMPPAGGSQGWAGMSGAPGTPSGPSPEERAQHLLAWIPPAPGLSFEQFYGQPAPAAPFGGEGMLGREHEATATAPRSSAAAPGLGTTAAAATGGSTSTFTGPGATGVMFYPSGGMPQLATGGTVTKSGIAQVHAGEVVVPVQTIQAGARQSQPGPGPVGQTAPNSFLSIAGVLAALMVLPRLLGGLLGGVQQQTQATQQQTQATQQNTQAKQQPPSPAPATPDSGTPTHEPPVLSGSPFNAAGIAGASGTPSGTAPHEPPVLSGSPFNAAGIAGAPGTPSGGTAPMLGPWADEGDIPQYAKGGPVEKTGLAMVHAGEYVVPSSAGGNLVVPGEIAPVATQGSPSPTLPSVSTGLGKGWELWAAILALLMLMGGGGKGKNAPGKGTSDVGKPSQPSQAEPDLTDADAAELGGQLAGMGLSEADAAELGGELAARDVAAPDLGAEGGTLAAAGDVQAMCAGGIASAEGGLQVHETSLPHRIKAGVRGLAAKGQVGLFRSGRLTSSMRGAPVADGKGGQLAVVHPGEMILPAPETSQVLGAMSSEGGAIVPSAAGGSVVALPEQQTVSSLGFQGVTLEQANPSSNFGMLAQMLALITALQKLVGGLGGLFGGGGGNQGGQGGGLFGGILSLFGGGGSSGGGVQQMANAANQAAPALQDLTSSTNNASGSVTGFAGMLGSLFSGGGGGGGGILGSVIGLPFKLLGGLIGLEGGGVIPSAAGGMVVGAGGAVADGKGGRLIVAHPQEMVLPAREARGLSNLLGNFQAGPPPEGGLGRILSMRMMVPNVPHFAQGAWEIDRDMLGMLHQGEAILPSSYAAGLRAMGGSAATTSSPSVTYGDTHVHLSAIDSRSGAQFLMANADTIGKAFFKAHRNGSRYTPNG